MKLGTALALLLLFSPAALAGTCRAPDGTQAVERVSTPARGSAERKAMLDALRVFVKKMSELDVIFVVRHIRSDCGWAWIETEPQSADGTQHYEPVQALLARRKGRWEYLESPPEWSECEPDPDCVDRARYFRKLAARHPGLPAAIFPK
jgi:hypothetical protein